MAHKILVVEDDPDVSSFLTFGLKHAGYEVFHAQDGEEGLYLTKATRPDLIVLDLHMPRMHGFAVCEALRADPELARIKIIVSTAKNYQVDRKAAAAAGADRFMVKPYGIKDLLDNISELLKNAS
ncbi:MAG: response regulator [Elusimicrobia bacterium]|nr:response regulator [Elusimicrobiota bacterium]